ncbi:ferritin-like domain-containing protein [cf. Phormidesmis sp. LEGE 11477]|uniref:ferritin-like domain-containing protein n=1 Tax=cf. Phormidesmis sp. LEGE 11477 TaxID=1828680 RepID=UPI00188024FA|nr:ferritin-like domain-containing protein [cf. Phormidesmis sp. LEGE 11477]MBE9060440.1 ferritin-like domain-containing protein [cf. Phormidesmis sp. LEGE 11477]
MTATIHGTDQHSGANANDTKHWTRAFSQNTKRWQQFAQEIDFSTLRLDAHLVDSIKVFQLGECSEGRTLKALAASYAQRHDNPDYLLAIQQFIKEEQRHAYYMAEALRANDVEPIAKQWSDGLFRKVRQLCGWEMMISVLLTAEVIAIAYYSTLAKASSDPQAKRLFERILQDEATHLQFHGEHLRCDRASKTSIRRRLHRLFHWLVIALVWVEHRQVLTYQFSSFSQFFKRCDALLLTTLT